MTEIIVTPNAIESTDENGVIEVVSTGKKVKDCPWLMDIVNFNPELPRGFLKKYPNPLRRNPPTFRPW